MAILLSIQPKHCCNILNKEKILEIRKSIPKCDLPCKVYIYCTHGKMLHDMKNESYWNSKRFALADLKSNNIVSSSTPFINGKVVAEFTLNTVERYGWFYAPLMFQNGYMKVTENNLPGKELDYDACCLTKQEIADFADDGKILPAPVFAWCIDNLIIYEKPKELSEFKKENKCHYADYEKGCCFEHCTFFDLKDCDGRYSKLYKAPQSWCYVEELKE